MSDNNLLELAFSELSSSVDLLKRFDNDALAVYHQIQRLQIAFENLRGSWTAISLVHKIVKDEIKGG